MNEIEQMYRNAGVEPKYVEGENLMEYSYGKLEYPPFTAEKQLEVIKVLANKRNGVLVMTPTEVNNAFVVGTDYFWGSCKTQTTSLLPFEQALASLINHLWQNLTEDEKQKLTNILKG